MDKKKLKELIKEFKSGTSKNGYEIGKHFYELKKYKKALVYLESYINSKDYLYNCKANKLLGDIYYNGLGIKKDINKALKYYDMVYNDDGITRILADEYYYGRNVKKDLEKAYQYYAKLADKNDLDSILKCLDYCKEYKKYNLYKYYKKYNDIKPNTEAKLYIATARFLNKGGTKEGIKENHQMLVELEPLNNKDVMFSLGSIYYHGYLGKVNYKKALDYFEKADRLGSLEACSYLGDYYYDGIIVKKDINKAVKYYDKAKSESDYAKYRLGRHMMENPFMGRKCDITDGYNLIKEASYNIGDASAYIAKLLREKKYDIYSFYKREDLIQNALRRDSKLAYVERGYLHLEKKEYEDAYNDFKTAYELGVVEASIPLANCYNEGLGVEKDKEKTNELLSNSKDNNVVFLNAKALLKEKKYGEAIKMLQSIVSENNDAKYELALIYIEAKHILNMETKGFKYLSEVSHFNKAANMKRLVCLYNGIGVKANCKFAVDELKKLSSLDGEANYTLGLAFETGNGAIKSLETALKYYEAASKKRYSKAKKKVEELTILIENMKIAEEKAKKEEAEKLAQEKMMREILQKARQEELNKLYNKYQNSKITIPYLEFPKDFNVLKLSYTTIIYGIINFDFEMKWSEKKVYINVTGIVRFIGFWSKERMDLFQEGLSKYVSKYIDDFFNKHHDYPFKITTNYNYTYEYEY